MKLKKKNFGRSHPQKNDTYFWQTHDVTLQNSPFTPLNTLKSQDNLIILELTNLEYMLKHLLRFLLVLNGCGVGDRLDKIVN